MSEWKRDIDADESHYIELTKEPEPGDSFVVLEYIARVRELDAEIERLRAAAERRPKLWTVVCSGGPAPLTVDGPSAGVQVWTDQTRGLADGVAARLTANGWNAKVVEYTGDENG